MCEKQQQRQLNAPGGFANASNQIHDRQNSLVSNRQSAYDMRYVAMFPWGKKKR